VLALKAAASNKPKTDYSAFATSNAIAYTVAIPPDQNVVITAPIIDKITLTLPVNEPPAILGVIKQRLIGFKNANGQSAGAHFKPGSIKYGVSAHLVHEPTGESVFVQAAPKSPKVAFLRFEMNPAKLGPDGIWFWRKLVADLLGLSGVWSCMASTATMTRVDLACDLVGVRIDRLALVANRRGKCVMYFGLNGKIETAYLGATSGKNAPMIAYNKKAQLQEFDEEPQCGDLEHTRMEMHVISRRPISTLADIANPFTKVNVMYLPRDVSGVPPHAWQHFTDSVRYRGLAAALEPIPQALRVNYMAGFDALPEPLWQPEKIWSKWNGVLADSGLLSD